jgi:cell division protein FtsA
LLPKVYYNNLMDVFKKLDIDVRDMVPTILWACEWILDFDLKDLGSLVVDIGANQTSYAVYEEWYPLFYGVIPLWWEDVTKDLSIWLQIDVKEAESLKREKATIGFDKVSQSDETIDMKFMADIVIARYEEIFEIVQEDLVHRNKDWRLPWWVYITWWASKIPDLEYLSKDVFKVASFRAKERHLQIWELHENQQFISLLGLYSRSDKYSFRKKRGLWFNFDFWFINSIQAFFKKLF